MWFDRKLLANGRKSPLPTKIVLKERADDAVIEDLVFKWVNNEFDYEENKAWFNKVIADYEKIESSEDEIAAINNAVDILLNKL